MTAENVLIVERFRARDFPAELSSRSKAETGFVTCIEAAKQGTYDGDRSRDIPRRSNRERLIATLGFKRKKKPRCPRNAESEPTFHQNGKLLETLWKRSTGQYHFAE